MNYDTTKIDEQTAKRIAATAKQLATATDGSKKRRGSSPLFVGDEIAFLLQDKQTTDDIRENFEARGSFAAWSALRTTDGRKVSLTRLTQAGNGIPFNGTEAEDCIAELLSFLEVQRQLRLKVVAVHDVPSLKAGEDARRYYRFEVI